MHMDITNAEAVNVVVKDFQPDVIIHGAAMTHVDQCEQNKELAYQLNVIGTKNVAEAAREVELTLCILVQTSFLMVQKGLTTNRVCPIH